MTAAMVDTTLVERVIRARAELTRSLEAGDRTTADHLEAARAFIAACEKIPADQRADYIGEVTR